MAVVLIKILFIPHEYLLSRAMTSQTYKTILIMQGYQFQQEHGVKGSPPRNPRAEKLALVCALCRNCSTGVSQHINANESAEGIIHCVVCNLIKDWICGRVCVV